MWFRKPSEKLTKTIRKPSGNFPEMLPYQKHAVSVVSKGINKTLVMVNGKQNTRMTKLQIKQTKVYLMRWN
jgi:hypothetical protein